MKKVGCATPFGYNRSNICTDSNKAAKAMELYSKIRGEWYTSKEIIDKCPNPCQFLRIRLNSEPYMHMRNTASIKFDKLVQVTESSVSYKELELLAEFGGYVGLFLGISFVHIGEVFESILQYITLKN